MRMAGLKRMRNSRLALCLVALLCCCIFLFPSAALAAGPNTGPQTWSLDSKNDTDGKKLPASVDQMERNYGTGDDGQSGSLSISGGGYLTWISDQLAQSDMTVPSGAWVLQIVTDSDWGTVGSNCQIEIGEWNGVSFISQTPPPQTVKVRGRSTVFIFTLFQTQSITIHAGKYMALRIKSLEPAGKVHIIYTGEDTRNSFLRSPETFASIPVPELTAGVLLALGLGGLGMFIFLRRKSVRKAT
jgi:hypothetical protein